MNTDMISRTTLALCSIYLIWKLTKQVELVATPRIELKGFGQVISSRPKRKRLVTRIVFK